ncbi:claudin-15-like isoform X1 [Pezoporus wallicus]|uniref:claudin-15-like isoform X1 n=1 Tax=Pezoporus wallicus TaxID=35540 RepID=UPI00254CB20C|nr:claudin-15-like isoform X1 [Pezoporus wallicus]XP_061321373.1 claudin-15-like isoform X1 [Pezoporus flaviventris]
MTSSCLQICSLLLALAGFTILLVTTMSNRWKVSDIGTVLVTTDWISEGLWMDCAVTAVRSLQCKKFLYMLSSDTYIQACRALMIASILLGFIAAVLSLLGLKCTKIGLSDEDGKTKFAVTGGFLFILGGLCSMVAVSWYAAMITAQFFDPLYAGTKYELGDALYLGWAGSVLCMLGGILLTCSCKGKKKQDYSFNKYPYSAGHAAPHQDAYTKNSETVISNKEYV